MSYEPINMLLNHVDNKYMHHSDL